MRLSQAFLAMTLLAGGCADHAIGTELTAGVEEHGVAGHVDACNSIPDSPRVYDTVRGWMRKFSSVMANAAGADAVLSKAEGQAIASFPFPLEDRLWGDNATNYFKFAGVRTVDLSDLEDSARNYVVPAFTNASGSNHLLSLDEAASLPDDLIADFYYLRGYNTNVDKLQCGSAPPSGYTSFAAHARDNFDPLTGPTTKASFAVEKPDLTAEAQESFEIWNTRVNGYKEDIYGYYELREEYGSDVRMGYILWTGYSDSTGYEQGTFTFVDGDGHLYARDTKTN